MTAIDTDCTETEIEAERERLQAALFSRGHKLGMPTESYQRYRAAAMEAIQRELDALPPKPHRPIEMEAGTVWVGGLLGSMPERPNPSQADQGDDLWRVFNTVQENVIRGGVSSRSVTGRLGRTRGIRAIREDVRINTQLWQAAVARIAA